MDREQDIRDRAHAIWESEGRPEGQHEAHWRRASAEIDEGAPEPGQTETMDESGAPVGIKG
ncbi:DUF2934 domain-containing protein [Falsirhodobacter algicola]|nr:DUF2934 domain-containing protein [Falsirhodobacter algicola]